MSDAPERVWAQDADPNECDFIGGGWWDDEIGSVQYPDIVEYVRADLYEAQAAEIERLRKWNADMVAKAAGGGVLDGYREMGAKLAAKNAEIERLRKALTFASVVVDQVGNDEDVEPNSLAVAISYINDVLGDPIQPRTDLRKEAGGEDE